ncbi:peptidylprolyl isomerase [Gaetbulibacter sp. M235]|uniref:peptidylprolyl isomerase n=1 Tax=Gaetbulibacter sp. M235 TaxID=3126510 RepID=UPI00374EC85C
MRYISNFIKFFLFSFLLLVIACQNKYPNLEDGIYAEMITSKGIMLAKLYYKKAPNTVANFVSLAEGTNTLVDSIYKEKKFYNGTIFYRVIDSFLIQGGDPLGTGFGNPGYRFDDEFNPDLMHDKPGVLGMANSGPNTNGSQFYITEIPNPNLDNVHSIFGELISGFDVLDSISNVKTSETNDKPLKDVVLKEINIIRIGVKAKAFDAPNIFINHFAELERIEKKRIEKEEAIKNASKAKFSKQLEKATLLPSGLQFFVSEKGTGKKLKENSKVLTDYTVYFEDGTLLQTSKLETAKAQNAVEEDRAANNDYQPIKADLSPNAKMIAGLKEGLQQLHVGDKATIFIPFYLAYGETGNVIIPPKSNLIFEVEVLELTK